MRSELIHFQPYTRWIRCGLTTYLYTTIVMCLVVAGLLSNNDLFAQGKVGVEQPGDDPKSWVNLTDEQVDEVTLRNLQRIVWAIHAYVEANESALPPAFIANPNLLPEKRLSGLVAVLPYLGVKPDYIQEDDVKWSKWKADNAAAAKLYSSVDLTKAWDDPANAEAAKTIVSTFVTPSGAALTEAMGYGVSHFALVRGSTGKGDTGLENGPFPFNEIKLHIPDITDGTDSTLAVGQIHEQLGPWIAAGNSTSRYVFHPSAKHDKPKFGSQFDQAAYFANCDGYTYFLDLKRVDPSLLKWAAGRSDDKPIALNAFRFASATEWKQTNPRGAK